MKKLLITVTAWLLATSVAMAQIVTGSVPNTFVNGTIIDATQVNADYNYIISQVNANAAKNGVNSDITALLSLATPLTPTQSGSSIYYAGLATGTVNAIVVATAIPANFTLATGKTIRFMASGANTGAVTLAVNGLAATPLLKASTIPAMQPLTGGELQQFQMVEAYYDGTNFQLLSRTGEQYGGYGGSFNIAAGATVDLGTAPTHYVAITGVATTISSFGSSASTNYPFYFVQFNAAHTLSNSASLVLLNGVSRVVGQFDRELFVYGGAGIWYEMAVYPNAPRATVTSANQLYIRNNAGTPNTKIDVTAAEVIMDTPAGGTIYVENYGTCTIDLTVNGANGLDTGVLAANTWYYIYTLSGGTYVACLASTSPTAPTVPAASPFKMRVGAIRTNTAAATLWVFQQRGATTEVVNSSAGDTSISTGIGGTCPGTVVASPNVWGVKIPSTASILRAQAFAPTTSNVTCISGGGLNSQACAYNPVAAGLSVQAVIPYTGAATTNYCGNAAGSSTFVSGWVDAVNAN